MVVSADDEILEFDPFEGDYGAPGDKVFTKVMCIARKPGPCSHCGCEINKGERIRRQSSKFDGELMTHRWCAVCCAAIVKYGTDLVNEDSDDLPEYELRSGLANRSA